jgi:HCO3- transporter family
MSSSSSQSASPDLRAAVAFVPTAWPVPASARSTGARPAAVCIRARLGSSSLAGAAVRLPTRRSAARDDGRNTKRHIASDDHDGAPSRPQRRRPTTRRPAVAAASVPGAPAPAATDAVVPDEDRPLGPATGGRFGIARWGEGVRGDLRRRAPLYWQDWADGFHLKTISTVSFMYFACIAPVVAFGGMMAVLTGGSMGVVECILACGGSGMLYAAFAGQPMTFLAPTGLTLAFTTALYGFCATANIPFIATYAWVGLWTSMILAVMALINACDLIKYCTRFTDDVFNSLISTNFIYEATRSLLAGFVLSGLDKTQPFTALALALGTFLLGRAMAGARTSRFLVQRARSFLSDFGPCIAIALMTAVACIPAVARVGLQRLAIPAKFALANNRQWLVPLHLTPVPVRLLSLVPAVLLTCLFFLDQNISVRVTNSPIHKFRKGPGYHLDMLMLAACTFICSILGLPLMCAGTIQSLNHVKALATYEQIVDSSGAMTGQERIVSVRENRLSGFLIHGLVMSSLLLLPVLQFIPMAVISGIFLFLGFKLIDGNEFLARIPVLFMDPSRYPQWLPKIPISQTNGFTVLQMCCLAALWVLKLNKRTAMFFPAVIGTLMFIRSRIAPRFFSEESLKQLDGAVVADDDAPVTAPSLSGDPENIVLA